MIVYKQDKASEIEAWYLGSKTSSYQAQCDTFINPTSKYLFDKTIIITDEEYDYSNILKRSNTIISRFPVDIDGYILCPYIVSNKYIIDYPFEFQTNVLNKYSLNDENCVIQNNIMKLKYSYFCCDNGYTKTGYLTQIGWISSILGILN